MKPPYEHHLIPKARELRKNATRQENHLWYDFLRHYPIRIRRQRPILGFIADFYCEDANLVIELDGSQHYTEQGEAYDSERSARFEEYGIDVIRFANCDIDHNFYGVCTQIDEIIRRRLPNDDRKTI